VKNGKFIVYAKNHIVCVKGIVNIPKKVIMISCNTTYTTFSETAQRSGD